MALLGSAVLSDLSPECTPKRNRPIAPISVHAPELGRSYSQDTLHHRGADPQVSGGFDAVLPTLPCATDATQVADFKVIANGDRRPLAALCVNSHNLPGRIVVKRCK